LLKEESIDEAVDSLYQALEFNPESAKLYYRLSAYSLLMGDETKGLSFFEKALKINFELHSELFQFMPKIKENKNLLNLLTNFNNK
jgi:tetratricopeptide (TPR) repeat protein